MESLAQEILRSIVAGGTAGGVAIGAIIIVLKFKLEALEKRLENTITHFDKTLDRISVRLDHIEDQITENQAYCNKRIDGMRNL